MVRNSTLTRLTCHGRGWRIAIGALVVSLSLVAVAVASQHPVREFPVLERPADLGKLSFGHRQLVEDGFGGQLPKMLWEGSVKTSAGTVSVVGNNSTVCVFGPIALTSTGFCGSTARARLKGLIYAGLPSHGRDRRVHVTGLVSSRVDEIELIPIQGSAALRRVVPAKGVFSVAVPAGRRTEVVGLIDGRSSFRLTVGARAKA